MIIVMELQAQCKLSPFTKMASIVLADNEQTGLFMISFEQNRPRSSKIALTTSTVFVDFCEPACTRKDCGWCYTWYWKLHGQFHVDDISLVLKLSWNMDMHMSRDTSVRFEITKLHIWSRASDQQIRVKKERQARRARRNEGGAGAGDSGGSRSLAFTSLLFSLAAVFVQTEHPASRVLVLRR